MELDLKFQEINCCETRGSIVTSHEETMETAIPEYCPDVARIVDTVGQLKVKEKTLSAGRLTIGAAVKVTVLYTSEESTGLRSMTVNVPFSCTLEEPRLNECRSVCVCGRIALVEARAVTSRKLYVRVLSEFEVEGIACPKHRICQDAEGEAALQLRKREMDTQILTEVLEREFQFHQECVPEPGQGIPEDLLLERLCLRVIDCQKISSKLVVKGEALASFLYRSEEQQLCNYDATLPFSQILDGLDLPEDATYQVEAWPIDSDVRVIRTDGSCRLSLSMRIGLMIKVYKKSKLTYIEDLYSTECDAQVKKECVTMETGQPAQKLRSEAVETLEFGQGKPFVCLTGAECGAVTAAAEGESQMLRTNLRLKVLYLDEAGTPVSTERVVELAVPAEHVPQTARALCEPAALRFSGGSCEVKIPVEFLVGQTQPRQLHTVGAVELQERGTQERPSLVLRRVKEGETLWDIAKQYYADPKTIQSVNQLEEEELLPEGILLIPKVR